MSISGDLSGRISHAEWKILALMLVPTRPKSMSAMIESVFPNLKDACGDPKNLTAGTIFIPLNQDMGNVNDRCLFDVLPWQEAEYISADSILEENYNDAILLLPS